MNQEYARVMEIKFVRGRTTNKFKDLALLAKQWWLATKDEQTGLVDPSKNITWRDATFSQECWNKKEEILEEKVKAMDWGHCIGMYHGEKRAKRALSAKPRLPAPRTTRSTADQWRYRPLSARLPEALRKTT